MSSAMRGTARSARPLTGTAAALLVCGLVGASRPAIGRDARPMGGRDEGFRQSRRVAAALSADTVRVGEPFALGIAVSAADSAAEFPARLPPDERFEQLGGVSVEEGADGGREVVYRLVAWKTGDLEIPAVRVMTAEGPVAAPVPPVVVASVLPFDPGVPVRLRPPRPPIEQVAFPWLLLLLALLALLVAWWLLRRRRRGNEEPGPADPGARAREELERLRAAAAGRRLPLPEFYDGMERAVRAYLVARRGWSPNRPVRDLTSERADGWRRAADARLSRIQERAALVRFAALEAALEAAVEDADSCLAWLREAEADEPAELHAGGAGAL